MKSTQYTQYTLTDDNLISNANIALEILAERLEKDGVIKNRKEVSDKYVFTLAKRGMFTRAFDTIFGLDRSECKPDTKYFVLLQIPAGVDIGGEDTEDTTHNEEKPWTPR